MTYDMTNDMKYDVISDTYVLIEMNKTKYVIFDEEDILCIYTYYIFK